MRLPSSLTLCAALLLSPAVVAQSATSSAPLKPRAPAPKEAPATRFVYRSTNVLRYNPLGLMSDNHVGVRQRLYKSDSPLLRDNFVGVGLMPQVTGAFSRLGALAEVRPLSVLRLWATFDVVGYYGIFGLFQSFSSPHSDFSDSAISALGALPAEDPKSNYPTRGTQLTFGLDLQMKVGPVAARNLSRLVRGSYQMREGDTVYYDQFYDVLAPNEGFFVSNDTDLLYVTDFGLVLGLRANVTHAFYSAGMYTAAERADKLDEQNPNGPHLRAGPLVTYTFYDEPGALLNRPTLIAMAHGYASHRWRTGADVSRFIPYAVIAFQVSGDLRPWN